MKQSKSFYRFLVAVLLALAFGLLALVFGVFLLGCGNGVVKTGSGKTTESYIAFTKTDAFNLRQVITADSSVSRTVMWQSNAEEKDAFVEYRMIKAENAAIQTQKEHINDKFTDNGKTTYVHTVTLKSLKW